MTPILLLAVALGAGPSPLAVDAATVDRGEVAANKPLVHAFQLRNTGDSTLTITDVASGCGCFRQQLSASTLAPGATAELTVGINLMTQPEGPNAWKLAVKFKTDAGPGEKALSIAAKVKKDVRVEPVALMLLSEKEIAGTVKVIDRRGKPLTVTAARLGIKDVSAAVAVATDADGQRTQAVTVTVAEACAAGQHADELCIDTDDPEYREIRIPVRVVKKSAATGVEATPATATLRFAKDQPTATCLIRLRDAQGREVAVDKVTADHPAVTTKWAAGPGPAATLRITVDRAKGAAGGVGMVTVTTKSAETVLVPVSWTLPQ